MPFSPINLDIKKELQYLTFEVKNKNLLLINTLIFILYNIYFFPILIIKYSTTMYCVNDNVVLLSMSYELYYSGKIKSCGKASTRYANAT